MVEIEACLVQFTSEAINQGRWGGQIATYSTSVDFDGRVTSIERVLVEKAAPLIVWVKIEQLESCIRRWQFALPGRYSISLTGGTVFGRQWIIDVSGANGRLRLRVPIP